MNGQSQDLAMHSPSLEDTVRALSSHLFPTRMMGMSSNDFFVDFICKRDVNIVNNQHAAVVGGSKLGNCLVML